MITKELTPMTAQIAVEWLSRRISRDFFLNWMPKTGLVVNDDNGHALCVGVLYLDRSSPVGVFGWLISNPDNKARESAEAIRLLIASMPSYAEKQGVKHLLTMFDSRGINRELDRFGFINADENVQSKYIRLGEC